MSASFQKYLVVCCVIFLSACALIDNVDAAPTVKITINPDNTKISAGSDAIALTARATGKGLSFKWELLGPGELDGRSDGPAVFYVPPNTLNKASGRAIVSVIVKDKSGEEASESVIFTISANAEGGKAPSPPTATKGQAVQTQNVDGFTIALQQCLKSGQNVTCDFLITNNENDRKFLIYRYVPNRDPETRIFDNLGNKYDGRRFQIGNDSGSRTAQILVVSGVPTRARVTFEEVSSDSTNAALFELGCHTKGAGYFTVQFRNIPFSR